MERFSKIIWIIAWSCLGIGAGLHNSRDNTSPRAWECDHYIYYFGFVLFIASLSSLTAAVIASNDPHAQIKFYLVSALTGITVGFMGDQLAGTIDKLRR